jgi:lincosamide nucleotidyltransferase A/C/D/E
MDEAGVGVWLDGGWAVDACVGAQRRRHRDLDLAVEEHHVPAAVDALKRHVFAELPAEWNFMLGDRTGRLIDLHVVVLDEDGRRVFGPPRTGEWDAADALSGEGTLGGQRVRCLTPHALVAFHTGYQLDADDWADVRVRCERFDIPIPDAYNASASPPLPQEKPPGSGPPTRRDVSFVPGQRLPRPDVDCRVPRHGAPERSAG